MCHLGQIVQRFADNGTLIKENDFLYTPLSHKQNQALGNNSSNLVSNVTLI